MRLPTYGQDVDLPNRRTCYTCDRAQLLNALLAVVLLIGISTTLNAADSLRDSQQRLVQTVREQFYPKLCTEGSTTLPSKEPLCNAINRLDAELRSRDAETAAAVLAKALDTWLTEHSRNSQLLSTKLQNIDAFLGELSDLTIVPLTFCQAIGVHAQYCRAPECFTKSGASCPQQAPTLDENKVSSWYSANSSAYALAPGHKVGTWAIPIRKDVSLASALLKSLGTRVLTNVTISDNFRLQLQERIAAELTCRTYRQARQSLAVVGTRLDLQSVPSVSAGLSSSQLFQRWKDDNSKLCTETETPQMYGFEGFRPGLELLLNKVNPNHAVARAVTSSTEWPKSIDNCGGGFCTENDDSTRLQGLRIRLNTPPLKYISLKPGVKQGRLSESELASSSGSLSLLLRKNDIPLLPCPDNFCELDLGVTISGLAWNETATNVTIVSPSEESASIGEKNNVQVDYPKFVAALRRLIAIPHWTSSGRGQPIGIKNLRFAPTVLPFTFDIVVTLPGLGSPIFVPARVDRSRGMGLSGLDETVAKAIQDRIGQLFGNSTSTFDLGSGIPEILTAINVRLDQPAWKDGRLCYVGELRSRALETLAGLTSPTTIARGQICVRSDGTLSLQPIPISNSPILQAITTRLISSIESLGLPNVPRDISTEAITAVIEQGSGASRYVVHVVIGPPLLRVPVQVKLELSAKGVSFNSVQAKTIADQVIAQAAARISAMATDVTKSALEGALKDLGFPLGISVGCLVQQPLQSSFCVTFSGSPVVVNDLRAVMDSGSGKARVDVSHATISGIRSPKLDTAWLTLTPKDTLTLVFEASGKVQMAFSAIAHVQGMGTAFPVSGVVGFDGTASINETDIRKRLEEEVLRRIETEGTKSLAGAEIEVAGARLSNCRLIKDPGAPKVALTGDFQILGKAVGTARVGLYPESPVSLEPTAALIELVNSKLPSLSGLELKIQHDAIPRGASWETFFVPLQAKFDFKLIGGAAEFGLRLKANGEIQINEPITIPLKIDPLMIGSLSIEKPSIQLFPAGVGRFTLKGRLAFAKGTADAVSINSTLSANVGAGTLKLEGLLQVANQDLARVNADLDIPNKRLTGMAKTIGLLSAVVPFESTLDANLRDCVFSQATSLALLGAKLDQTLILKMIGGCGNNSLELAARGRVQLGPLGSADGGLDVLLPAFAVTMFANANVGQLATVGVRISPNILQADIDAHIIRASIELPNSQSLDENLIKSIIANLLHPRIDLEALLNGKIELSPSSGGGKGGSPEGGGSAGPPQNQTETGPAEAVPSAAQPRPMPVQGLAPGAKVGSTGTTEQRGWPGDCAYRYLAIPEKSGLVRREYNCGTGWIEDVLLTAEDGERFKAAILYIDDLWIKGTRVQLLIEKGSVHAIRLPATVPPVTTDLSLSTVFTPSASSLLLGGDMAAELLKLQAEGKRMKPSRVRAIAVALELYIERESPVALRCLDPDQCEILAVRRETGSDDGIRIVTDLRRWDAAPGSFLSDVILTGKSVPQPVLQMLRGDIYASILGRDKEGWFLHVWTHDSSWTQHFGLYNPATLQLKTFGTKSFSCRPARHSITEPPQTIPFNATLLDALRRMATIKEVLMNCEGTRGEMRSAVVGQTNEGELAISIASKSDSSPTPCLRLSSGKTLAATIASWKTAEDYPNGYPSGPDLASETMLVKVADITIASQDTWRSAGFGRNPALLIGACR